MEGNDEVSEIPPQLRAVAEALRREAHEESETVRNLLQWFRAQRRGFLVVNNIRKALSSLGIETVPDFQGTHIDSLVEFRLLSRPEISSVSSPDSDTRPSEEFVVSDLAEAGGDLVDPTFRLGRLKAANQAPISVNRGSPVVEAITKMLLHDFSQLPVMTGEHKVHGVVTWQSIGSRLALGKSCDTVDDCLEKHHQMNLSVSLFRAAEEIAKHQFILVHDDRNRVTGIVTASDLSEQFGQLGEPFLLIGEIENYVRRLIERHFSNNELEQFKDLRDGGRKISSVSDLSFGEYVRVLQNPNHWIRLNLPIDRGIFTKALEEVGAIRNEVMHFDPDGVVTDQLEKLRQFSQLLETLAHLKVV